eukprot:g14664.t1
MSFDAREELAEALTLLETAKGPKVRKALCDLIASLQTEPTAAAPAEPDAGSSNSNGSVPAAVSGSHLPEAKDAAAAAATATAASPPAVPGASRTKVDGGVPAAPRAPERRYATVEKFAWDQGSYNSPKVSIYVPLEGVGAAKERVSCAFTARGFDLTVHDLNGKDYRLLQNNLEKDIVADESKILVKRDKVIVKLQKVKAEFGSYDNWSNLAAKKQKKVDAKADPQAGLMDMMKDMYDEGDESTKKLIGEAMLKSHQKRGEAPGSSFDTPDYGSGYGKSSSLGGGLGGGLGGAAGNLDGMMDDVDLDNDNGDGGWGAGGKDDFGFGSAVPPPKASDPVPAAAEEEEEESEEVADGKLPAAAAVEG